MNLRLEFTIAGLLLAGGGLLISSCTKDKPVPTVEREFICEDDGKLVERHVGVLKAIPYNSGMWDIHYTDGAVAYYHQDAGESCMVEEIR